jgi:hypothetical protein
MDFLDRLVSTDSEFADGDDGYSVVMGEYMSLVDEYLTSYAGRAFLSWSRRLAMGRFPPLSERGLVTGEDLRPPKLVDGANAFLALMENCHARLVELDGNAELQSACWCFHAPLFGEGDLFDHAAFIRGDELRISTIVNAKIGEDPLSDDDREGILKWSRESSARQLRMQAILSEISDTDRWIGKRKMSSWDGVVTQLRVGGKRHDLAQ